MNEGSFAGVGELNIFWRSWHPEGSPRGVVAIVPGFNSHSGYYDWVAEQLTADGLAVYAVDLRGRGKSDGERYYVDTFDEYVSDVSQLVSLASSSEPGLPIFLLGHSAGGVVSCLYAIDNQSQLAGLICESFAFQVPAPDIVLSVLKGISHLAPHLHVLPLKNADFSRDPAVVEQMNSDPLIAKESQPAETIAAMVRSDEQLKTDFPKITLPLLILHGTGDKATKFAGSQFFFDTAGSTDKTIKLYDGVYHDPLHDTGKETVMQDIKSWIDARLPSNG
ncbi:MAG: lysophospholipase [Acidobacteriota bacterium]